LAGHKVAGPLLRRLGVVFVERFDIRQGVDDVRRLAALATGRPLFFFAEGTFTRQSGLRTFRLGAFQIAAQNGLGVIPIALAGTREILRDESWLPKFGSVRVSIGENVAVEGDDWAAALRLRDAARAFILRDCGETDLDGTGT
jgi:1-acyl-sn-glycerol-3-phosphate acyltransferase